MRHFTITAVLQHLIENSLCNLLHEYAVLYFLLLLKFLRLKNSFIVNLRAFAFDGLKSGVLALLFGLDETGASNRIQKHVEFQFRPEIYEPRFSDFRKLR